MEIQRKKTRKITVGDIEIGGDAPIAVQTMTKCDTHDMGATVEQILRFEAAGCDLIRVAVLDKRDVAALKEIKECIHIPLIADIHFTASYAIGALEQGADCVRINPGNIGGKDQFVKVLQATRNAGAAMRIGVNAGSLDKEIEAKYGMATPEALVESALRFIEIAEEQKFANFKVALKASDVRLTVDAYRLFAKQSDYPLHLGVTEAGTTQAGTVRSSVALGILLAEGIGDTIRISLTDDSVEEIKVGVEILRSLGLRAKGPQLISCPSCGRCEIDLIKTANIVDEKLSAYKEPIKVAVMGCVVNGPGEAKDADFGIAGGRGLGLIFREGEIIKKVKEEEMIDELMKAIEEKIGPPPASADSKADKSS